MSEVEQITQEQDKGGTSGRKRPSLLKSLLTDPLRSAGDATRNALEIARFGGLETGDVSSPYEVMFEHRNYKLRRYVNSSAKAPDSPVILLIPPLMLTAEVYDVSPTSSAIGALVKAGCDPWVVDFGAPEHEDGGLSRTLSDHVLAVSDAVDRVREIVGGDIHLCGYSQGGMFCYQAAAYRRSRGLRSIVALGSPVDTHAAGPMGISGEVLSSTVDVLSGFDIPRFSLPAWMARTGFRLLDPPRAIRDRLNFLMQLHDREALLVREHERRFLRRDGWVAWSGPALREMLENFIGQNRMVMGGFVIDEQMVTLADITCPIMVMAGDVDTIAMPEAVRSIIKASPSAEVWGGSVASGHFGLVVGSNAVKVAWPTVANWLRWRDGLAEQPNNLELIVDSRSPVKAEGFRQVEHSAELAAALGTSLVKTVAKQTGRAIDDAINFVGEVSGQLPKLMRLDQIDAKTQISLGLMMDERSRRDPNDELFLFEDRAHTQIAVKQRIDAVVKGLISVGVRRGQHVGVLMPTRPSALTIVAALSRIGAVVVLQRPGGDIRTEAKLGSVECIITDPESADAAVDAVENLDIDVLVLGGGAEYRDLGRHVIDLERINPDEVVLPKWYTPNPGRATDLAFIVFSGRGEGTIAKRITNHRWALSALGTASSAALTKHDTLYAVSPLYHPSGLLMTIGGAVASGARIALSTGFQPESFWEEVRRYGVTVVTYTWSQLLQLVNAPSRPSEQHHPVRLFVGSGMPPGLARRVMERFKPARVLELYASTEGDAVLINLSQNKIGSKGRPLPGSADLAIVAWDFENGHPIEGKSGYVRRAADGQVGMLLSRVRVNSELAPGHMMRGVFEREDAWHVTGAFFRRDTDGDYWLASDTQTVIRTERGPVHPGPITDGLSLHPAVDAAVCGKVAGPRSLGFAVATVKLRQGAGFELDDVNAVFDGKTADQVPDFVQISDQIALTDWYRPVLNQSTAGQVPAAGCAWVFDSFEGQFVPLDEQTRSRIIAELATTG